MVGDAGGAPATFRLSSGRSAAHELIPNTLWTGTVPPRLLSLFRRSLYYLSYRSKTWRVVSRHGIIIYLVFIELPPAVAETEVVREQRFERWFNGSKPFVLPLDDSRSKPSCWQTRCSKSDQVSNNQTNDYSFDHVQLFLSSRAKESNLALLGQNQPAYR